MKQTLKATLSLALSLALCTALALNAAADTVITGSGTGPSDPKLTVTVTYANDTQGNTVSTETTQTQWTDKDKKGLGTAYDQTVSSTTVTSPGGKTLSQEGFVQGSETTTKEEMPPLTLPLEEGKQTTEVSSLKGGTTGSLKEDDPNNYDQTTTTVEQQREISAQTSEQKITLGSTPEDGQQTILTPVTPQWTGQEKDITAARPDRFGQNDDAGPAGYDFRYTGWGPDSHYGAYHHTTTYDPETQSPITVTEESDIIQFLLTDTTNPDSPDHTVYCSDLCTNTREGWWYRIDNLENAGYYTDQAAADHIRAIAEKGYWGTAAGQTGSLENFVKTMTDAQQNGTDSAKAMLEGCDFGLMTEGEAQAATQMAIWQYGHRVSADAELRLEPSNFNGSYGWAEEEGDARAWARINAAANYLASLSQPSGTSTQIITEEKFIEDMALTIKERLAVSEDGSSDLYCADLSFTLVVTPGEKDSLNVQVVQDGQIVATQNILPGQREYTIQNLSFAENSDVNFSLEMTGAQYLEQGVYIYTSEVRQNDSAQTFVGLAEGNKSVDLTMDVTLQFDVTDAVVTTTRVWRNRWNDTETPGYSPSETSKDPPKPTPALAHVPQTGDSLSLWLGLILAGTLGLLILRKDFSLA